MADTEKPGLHRERSTRKTEKEEKVLVGRKKGTLPTEGTASGRKTKILPMEGGHQSWNFVQALLGLTTAMKNGGGGGKEA